MSLLTYLVLGVIGLYLFQVNPVLCLAIVGGLVFFKVQGARHGRNQSHAAPAPDAALVALCVSLLARQNALERPSSKKGADPLGGLFLD